jgi:hypothetical protein
LTTDQQSVLRSAYEATYGERPLVLSDTPALRAYFPDAVFTFPRPEDIAAAVTDAISRHENLRAIAARSREVQLDRWQSQAEQLRRAVA